MNEQRRRILEMLAEGKITADEAARLIDALDREQPEPAARPKPKYLRVLVNTDDSAGGESPTRVNVRVPIALLRGGIRLTSLIPPEALTKINAEMGRSGVPIDLTQLKPQDLDELIDQLDDLTVDVDNADAKVQVFCE